MPNSEFDPTEQCYGRDCERIMLRSRMTWAHHAWWCPDCTRRILENINELFAAAKRAKNETDDAT